MCFICNLLAKFMLFQQSFDKIRVFFLVILRQNLKFYFEILWQNSRFSPSIYDVDDCSAHIWEICIFSWFFDKMSYFSAKISEIRVLFHSLLTKFARLFFICDFLKKIIGFLFFEIIWQNSRFLPRFFGNSQLFFFWWLKKLYSVIVIRCWNSYVFMIPLQGN